MNLPIVIDIAIGLILIYLMLSLLASEIQELLSTLLQWRAVHLKESIEGFLSGNDPERLYEARQLANQLYSHPTIRALNHEAKGTVARLPRLLTAFIPKKVFGVRGTGPSYIAATTFAQSLLDTLGVDALVQNITTLRIKSQLERLLGRFDYKLVEGKLRGSIRAYEHGRMTLDELVNQVATDIKGINESVFEKHFATEPQKALIASQLSVYLVDILQASYIYLSLMWRSKLSRRTIELVEERQADEKGADEKALLTAIHQWKDVPKSLQPTLRVLAIAWLLKSENEVNIQAIAQLSSSRQQELGLTEIDLAAIPQAELFYKSLVVYENINQVVAGEVGLEEVETTFQAIRDNEELPDLFDTTLDQTIGVLAFMVRYPEVQALVEKIPLSVLESLQTPARNMQLKLDSLNQGLNQFQQELAHWFDRSLERAGGVYKRNARLVAFCVGMLIAVTANADTLHMVNQLAQEQVLRTTVTDLVDKLPANEAFDAQGSPNFQRIDELTQEIYPALPLGWGDRNLREQAVRDGLLSAVTDQPPQLNPMFILHRIFGWLITGLAVSMGAAFWYDILSKFMNVRNVGKKPPNPETPQS